jgi:hypothetical protein
MSKSQIKRLEAQIIGKPLRFKVAIDNSDYRFPQRIWVFPAILTKQFNAWIGDEAAFHENPHEFDSYLWEGPLTFTDPQGDHDVTV